MTPPADTAPAHAVPAPLQPLALARAESLDRTAPVRAWAPLGTVDAGVVADVDGAGAVQLRGAGWHLDWWVGAEDRWHHPSVEAAVRQRWVEDAPVLETAMRVPGGDVVHRAYGVRASSAPEWDDTAVVVEVRNDSAVPVALALAVRPLRLDGAGGIGTVEVDGAVVRVDGTVAAVLSRPPARLAHGAPGMVAAQLSREEDQQAARLSVGPADGNEVALVVPLPHAATVRVLLPRPPADGGRRRRRRRGAVPGPTATWDAPDHSAVVRGWEAHTRDAARVELPEPVLGSVLRASQRSLALAALDVFDEPAGTGSGVTAATRVAWVAEALARCGIETPLAPLATGLAGAQRLGGAVVLADRSDATAALLHAAAPVLATGDPVAVEDLLGPVAKAVHHLGKELGRGRRPPGHPAEALGRVAPALRAIEQPDVADEAERLAETHRAAAVPVDGPRHDEPLRDGLRRGNTDSLATLLERCREGAPGALPDRVGDAGVPEGSLGFDVAAVAHRLTAVLDAVLVEGPDGPVLFPAWPRAWWGQSLEAHGIRTRWGRASFAVRWHGERPALLWEVEPAGADDPVPTLTAPALDPAWRGEGRSGEALLAPVEVPPTLVALRPRGAGSAPTDEGGTFS